MTYQIDTYRDGETRIIFEWDKEDGYCVVFGEERRGWFKQRGIRRYATRKAGREAFIRRVRKLQAESREIGTWLCGCGNGSLRGEIPMHCGLCGTPIRGA